MGGFWYFWLEDGFGSRILCGVGRRSGRASPSSLDWRTQTGWSATRAPPLIPSVLRGRSFLGLQEVYSLTPLAFPFDGSLNNIYRSQKNQKNQNCTTSFSIESIEVSFPHYKIDLLRKRATYISDYAQKQWYESICSAYLHVESDQSQTQMKSHINFQLSYFCFQ